MSQITDLNHYIPRGYLTRWSADGGKTVWEHKLVIPHEDFPMWRRAPLREAGSRRNLYDAHIPGLPRDHFERWLKNDIEDPAYQALSRLEASAGLSAANWEALVQFAVAQDFRTPKGQHMHEALERHYLPKVMDEALRRTIETFDSDAVPLPDSDASELDDEAPVIDTTITPQDDGALIQMSVLVGSTSWMQSNKRMIREFTQKVSGYVWQIIKPCPPQTWPTCDHPLVRFERLGTVNIHGTGWFREGTEIFLPLTPHYALYSKVGELRPRTPVASRIETRELVQLLVGHADRSVFADRKGYKWIEWESRRYVDLEDYNSARP